LENDKDNFEDFSLGLEYKFFVSHYYHGLGDNYLEGTIKTV